MKDSRHTLTAISLTSLLFLALVHAWTIAELREQLDTTKARLERLEFCAKLPPPYPGYGGDMPPCPQRHLVIDRLLDTRDR